MKNTKLDIQEEIYETALEAVLLELLYNSIAINKATYRTAEKAITNKDKEAA